MGKAMSLLPLARSFRAWAHTPPNDLTAAVAARRAGGLEVIDLVGAGAYPSGLGYPNDRLHALAAEAARASAIYRPDPRGQVSAREAVAAFYERRGLPTDPSRILLTPGTSVAYLYILRLLANPGDEVLVPSPGYPLFDDLCLFAGVHPRRYHLRRQGARWALDLEDLEFQVTSRTRAIMLVSPHNPLGIVLDDAELMAVGEVCRRKRCALVFDEVFSEFVEARMARPRGEAPLTIVLNGLSKMLSLPGIKIGWMRVEGDEGFLDAAEYASDLFLPVSELSQAMVAPLLASADEVAAAFARDLAARRSVLADALASPVLEADAGVYLCLPLPPDRDDDALALAALDRGVLVHPGHLYDLPGHLVMTCIARPADLAEGGRRIGDLLRGV
jgi:aspartate/methionine/tyrosine aminotransferase